MGTFIVLLVLAVIVAGAIYSMYRDKKNGKSSCGAGCSSCAGCGRSCAMPPSPENGEKK